MLNQRRFAEGVHCLERPAKSGSNPLTVLNNKQFRLLFLGTTLSMMAFGMMQVVQGVVAFDLTGKNGSVGFVYLGQGFAMLILSPIGGALSDRVSKKKMLSVPSSSSARCSEWSVS